MSETKKKTNSVTKKAVTEIDYDKLTEAIVKAHMEIEEKAKENELREKERKATEWRKAIGYNPNKKITHFTSTLKMLFVNKDAIKGDKTTMLFLKMATEMMLNIGEWFLYLLALTGIVAVFKPQVIGLNNTISFYITTVLTVIFVFVFARLLRISRLEIDNIEDRNYLNDVIGSFMAVVGTILALISLFGGKQ